MTAPAATRKQPVPPYAAKEDTSPDPVCEESPAPRVPEGEYFAHCGSVQQYRNPRFKRDEIRLKLTLVECKHAGTKLYRFYPRATAGKKRSNFNREWVIANQGIAPVRGDRMSPKKFKGKLFRVRVVTVHTDANQQELPRALQYSKVGSILELVQTNEPITAN